MAFSFQPKLASLDGLVLYLDAANTKSYPGSGTTWTDLSQTAITGSLTNGPTFSGTTNNGSIVFDGTDDFILVNTGYTNVFKSKTQWAASFWVRPSSLTNNPVLLGPGLSQLNYFDLFLEIGQDIIYMAAGGGPNPGGAGPFIYSSGSFTLRSNQTYNVVYVYNNATGSIYLNGINHPVVKSGNGLGTMPNSDADLRIGGFNQGAYYLSGSISQVQIYNRALSTTEILQNYNAICGRFGKTPTITDLDALSFVNAANISNETQQSAINTLVTDLKGAGLWSKMKAIYPFVGGTATTHKWNLKDPRDLDAAFRLTFSGGWTHSSTGVAGNGTNAYADTYLIPTTNLIENNTHHSNYSRTDGVSGVEIGGMSSTGYFWHLNRYSEPGYENICLSYMYRTAQIEASNTNGTGYYIASRTASNIFKVFKNSSQLGINTSTTSGWSTTNVKLYIGARNNQGTADAYSNRNLAFATIGDGLTDTDAANLYTIVQKYQTTLGRQV